MKWKIYNLKDVDCIAGILVGIKNNTAKCTKTNMPRSDLNEPGHILFLLN